MISKFRIFSLLFVLASNALPLFAMESSDPNPNDNADPCNNVRRLLEEKEINNDGYLFKLIEELQEPKKDTEPENKDEITISCGNDVTSISKVELKGINSLVINRMLESTMKEGASKTITFPTISSATFKAIRTLRAIKFQKETDYSKYFNLWDKLWNYAIEKKETSYHEKKIIPSKNIQFIEKEIDSLATALDYLDIKLPLRIPNQLSEDLILAGIPYIQTQCSHQFKINEEERISTVIADGANLIIALSDGSILVIDAKAGNTLHKFRTPAINARLLAINNNHLLIASENQIYVYDKNNGERIQKLQGHKKDIIALFVTSKEIISVSQEGAINFWNQETYNCEKTVANNGDNIICATLSENNLYVCSTVGIAQWDILKKECVVKNSPLPYFRNETPVNIVVQNNSLILTTNANFYVVDMPINENGFGSTNYQINNFRSPVFIYFSRCNLAITLNNNKLYVWCVDCVLKRNMFSSPINLLNEIPANISSFQLNDKTIITWSTGTNTIKLFDLSPYFAFKKSIENLPLWHSYAIGLLGKNKPILPGLYKTEIVLSDMQRTALLDFLLTNKNKWGKQIARSLLKIISCFLASDEEEALQEDFEKV